MPGMSEFHERWAAAITIINIKVTKRFSGKSNKIKSIKLKNILCQQIPVSFSFFLFFFFVVNSVIHWNEKALGSHVFPIPIPPPTSLPTRSLQVLPEHQVRSLVSCIQPGPVICFTLDSIHVSMLFSWKIKSSRFPLMSFEN